MLNKIIFIAIVLLIGTGVMLMPVQSGILLTDERGKPFIFLPWDSDELTIGWKHSVELTPWKETYQITDEGNFSFWSTLYQSYGAGTPDVEGNVKFLQNGYVKVTGIERDISYYSLFYAAVSEYYLEDNKKQYPLSQYVPDHTDVQIHYKRMKMFEWLYFQFRSKNKEG